MQLVSGYSIPHPLYRIRNGLPDRGAHLFEFGPHGRGLRAPYEAEVHHVNPTCGDEVTVRVHLSGGEGRDAKVEDLSYDALGCSISQAATSVLTQQVIGQSVGDALKTITAFTEMVSSRGTVDGDEEVLGDGVAFAGVAKYPARVKCALLGWMAFKDAVARAETAEQTPGPSEEH